jgi:hypothetical protein
MSVYLSGTGGVAPSFYLKISKYRQKFLVSLRFLSYEISRHLDWVTCMEMCVCTYCLCSAYSVEHNPSSEDNSCTASQSFCICSGPAGRFIAL